MDKITEQHIERIQTGGYELGKAIGLEIATKFLLGKSAELFSSDKDDLAMLVRSLAKEVESSARLIRKGYDESYRKYQDESWKILDEAIKDIDWQPS